MATTLRLRGVCVGAGYFSQFQYDAWRRIAGVEIAALTDVDAARAREAAATYGIPRVYGDYREMLDRERPDFVDVITPPPTHRRICADAAARGMNIICQKPVAPTYDEAAAIVEDAGRAGVRFMVHENFRFQPWHRQIRRLLDDGAIGELFTLTFRCRTGDGWGENAYIPRQPYFRDYPRLFVYETGVHFIDTFRYLAGDVRRVGAWLRRLNPVIRGEDCALLVLEFANGAVGQLDANRYNEPAYPPADVRYTFGEFLLEGSAGSIRLHHDGRITLKRLGEPETDVPYPHERRGFGGDCVYFTQQHFIDRLRDGRPFETDGDAYLANLRVQEAIYESAKKGTPVSIDSALPRTKPDKPAAPPDV